MKKKKRGNKKKKKKGARKLRRVGENQSVYYRVQYRVTG